MRQYVLGVDGGATKTHYALFDIEGNMISYVRSGKSNHEHFEDGYDGTRRELEKTIYTILHDTGLNMEDISFGIFGMAGVDIKSQQEDISNLISQIGLRNFRVCNDAFLGIKAGSKKKYGICSNNGTGTCCVGLDHSGNSIQIGGTGYIFGDSAGAGFLGEMTIRKVYDSIYRCGRQTIMKEMLFENLKINQYEHLVEAFYKRGYPKYYKMHEFSRIVFRAANLGDEVALDILKYVGREAGKCVVGAIRKLDFSKDMEIDVVMSGSVYVKGENPSIIGEFKNTIVSMTSQPINFILLRCPPVTGSVLWAIEELNKTLDPVIREKVVQSLEQAYEKETEQLMAVI